MIFIHEHYLKNINIIINAMERCKSIAKMKGYVFNLKEQVDEMVKNSNKEDSHV